MSQEFEVQSEESDVLHWAVVCFEFSNELSTVPRTWIRRRQSKVFCLWPEGDKSVTSKIKKSAKPEENWVQYDVRILKEYENYKDARAEEERLEVESTDQENSCKEDNLGRGQRKIKRKADSEFTSSLLLPPEPKIQILDVQGDNNNYVENLQGNYFVSDTNGTLEKEHDNSISFSPLPSSSFSTVTVSNVSQPDRDQLFLNVFKTLIDVKETIKDIKQFIENLAISINNNPSGTSTSYSHTDTTPKVPFQKHKKLLKYEEALKTNQDFRNQLETVFYIMGGTSTRDAIRRGLKRIFSNRLATHCSWSGRGGNHPIQHLTILTILKAAVRRRFPDITDQHVEAETKIWFRQAHLRYLREQTHK